MIGSVVPGAGAFEIAAHAELMKYKDTIKGRSRLGYLLFCLITLGNICFLHGFHSYFNTHCLVYFLGISIHTSILKSWILY